MAHNSGLLQTNNGLLLGIVAYNFQLLGCPGLTKSTDHPSIVTRCLGLVYEVGLWLVYMAVSTNGESFNRCWRVPLKGSGAPFGLI